MPHEVRGHVNVCRRMKDLKKLPVKTASLMPHSPPMLLVDEVIEREGDMAKVSAVAPTGGIFCRGDSIRPEFAVEVVAQAMAAVDGYDAVMAGDGKRSGFLVGIEDFRWIMDISPGESLLIVLEKLFEFSQVAIMKGSVLKGDTIAAHGIVKVWQESAS